MVKEAKTKKCNNCDFHHSNYMNPYVFCHYHKITVWGDSQACRHWEEEEEPF